MLFALSGWSINPTADTQHDLLVSFTLNYYNLVSYSLIRHRNYFYLKPPSALEFKQYYKSLYMSQGKKRLLLSWYFTNGYRNYFKQ